MIETLICEGICNGGQVQRFDAAVRNYGRSDVGGDGENPKTATNVPDSMLALARGFTHTPHMLEGKRELRLTYACLTCGSVRAYGYA